MGLITELFHFYNRKKCLENMEWNSLGILRCSGCGEPVAFQYNCGKELHIYAPYKKYTNKICNYCQKHPFIRKAASDIHKDGWEGLHDYIKDICGPTSIYTLEEDGEWMEEGNAESEVYKNRGEDGIDNNY